MGSTNPAHPYPLITLSLALLTVIGAWKLRLCFVLDWGLGLEGVFGFGLDEDLVVDLGWGVTKGGNSVGTQLAIQWRLSFIPVLTTLSPMPGAGKPMVDK